MNLSRSAKSPPKPVHVDGDTDCTPEWHYQLIFLSRSAFAGGAVSIQTDEVILSDMWLYIKMIQRKCPLPLEGYVNICTSLNTAAISLLCELLYIEEIYLDLFFGRGGFISYKWHAIKKKEIKYVFLFFFVGEWKTSK